MSMTHRERLLAAVAGDGLDRTPIALWRHHPVHDATAEGLAAAVTAFQADLDLDMVKVTPASGYPAEAWGATLEPDDNAEGTRRYVRRVVMQPADWHALAPLAADEGVFARELDALTRVRAAVGPSVHVFATIFSPLTIAKQMAGPAVLEHVRTCPDDLLAGLAVIAETNARFARACVARGADGVFFATQFARSTLMDFATYRRFGLPYDLPVVEAARGAGALLLLHLCGDDVLFDLAPLYAADIVNWHDQTTAPSLADALRMLPRGAVLGGLDRGAHLDRGTPADVRAAVRRAVDATGGRRLVIGAGCVTLVTTPGANLRAARAAVEPATTTWRRAAPPAFP